MHVQAAVTQWSHGDIHRELCLYTEIRKKGANNQTHTPLDVSCFILSGFGSLKLSVPPQNDVVMTNENRKKTRGECEYTNRERVNGKA